jgi:type VI secretion system secreted protein Hcp
VAAREAPSGATTRTSRSCHTLDKASPKLALFCCRGDHIPSVKVELCRATGDKQKYLEYRLYDTIVSSVRPAGAAKGAETLPLEVVCFNYGKIEIIYTETDHKTGHAKGDVFATWDLVQNRGR